MAYSTVQDIIAVSSERDVIQLSDDSRVNSIDEGVVAEAISKADALIDSYCSGRYVVPISPVPRIIGDISAQLAYHFLYERRHRQNMPDSMIKIYDRLVVQLKQISEGVTSLPAAMIGTGSVSGTGPAYCNKTKADRLFPWKGTLDKW